MRAIGVKVLRDNLSRELKDLPLSVTSDGQSAATILTIEQYNKLVSRYSHEVATSSIPVYNPSIHKPGDTVLVQKGKKWVESTVPMIDAEGNPYD